MTKAVTEELRDTIDSALKALLKKPGLEDESRIKALAVAVRWEAVKNKLVLAEHGSGFGDLEDD